MGVFPFALIELIICLPKAEFSPDKGTKAPIFIFVSSENKAVVLNRKKAKTSTKVNTNDKVELFNIEIKEKVTEKKINFKPSNVIIKANENSIIDNNEDFIVVNKESGISVQGGTKSKKNLIDIFKKSKIFEGTKPYSVHRLDKDTSGVFIIAKKRETAQLLTSLFRLRKIHKTYLAVCEGEINKDSGELKHDLVRYEGKKKVIENLLSLPSVAQVQVLV